MSNMPTIRSFFVTVYFLAPATFYKRLLCPVAFHMLSLRASGSRAKSSVRLAIAARYAVERKISGICG
eukprot:SAG31_NODE_549_length_14219_cov_5.808188_5_plen_68_part_00